ncbi:MAG: hypothetical protein ACK4F4_07240 [Hylemonella sp.]|uniref:hypothetical protein n=1 Tax=Hylemonella sp. TaxID=2066020 RepID=UPI003919AB8B
MTASATAAHQVRPARQVLLERLIDAGTWVTPDELTQGVSTCPPAVEDALADLVIEGKADYREHSGYRLAGSLVQRRAAKLMLQAKRKSQAPRRCGVASEVIGDEIHIGVAEERDDVADLGMVMYQLAVPLPADPTERLATQQRAVQAVLDKFPQTEETT